MKEVFTIVQRKGRDKGQWVRIGAAFENRDGSLTVKLDALPVNGELHIREKREWDQQREGWHNDDQPEHG